MRKLNSALIAAVLTLLAAPARAQDYPPSTVGLTVSGSTVSPGETFTVSGDGAEPGSTISFKLTRSSSTLGAWSRVLAAAPGVTHAMATVRPQTQSPVSLGMATANADGEFSARATIPAGTDPGVNRLTASSGGDILGVATLQVLAASSAGGMPFTGAKVLPGLLIGATLIVAGGLLLLTLKRPRRAA